MRRYEITTARGDRYFIHENGDIERTDMEFTVSGQWKMLGIQHVQKSVFIPLNRLAGMLPELELLCKKINSSNYGFPQWTVRDLDHGTTREWGNTHYHGIKSIRVVHAERL